MELTSKQHSLLQWVKDNPVWCGHPECIPGCLKDWTVLVTELLYEITGSGPRLTKRGEEALDGQWSDTTPPQGVKLDDGKPKLGLLLKLGSALTSVTKVLEYGNKKYGSVENFQRVDDGEARYVSAALRHLLAGPGNDEESDLPHLWHAATDLLMACWFHNRKERNG